MVVASSSSASPICTWLLKTSMATPNLDHSSRLCKFPTKLMKDGRNVNFGSLVSCSHVSSDHNTVNDVNNEHPAIVLNKKPAVRRRRVVVTGLGVVTPLGNEVDEFYGKLLDGISGISSIEAFDCSPFPTKIAGEIKSFSSDGWVSAKLSKRADKYMLYMLTAGKKAVLDGGLTNEVLAELDKKKCGVIIGSSVGGIKLLNESIEALRISPKKLSPFCVPYTTINMGPAILAMDLGWMGPNYSLSAACATSNYSILCAANHIRRDESDMMLCGGTDSAVIPIAMGGFSACKVLTRSSSNDPTKASRPWDAKCDGFVLGEGAGVLLLEELEHAKRRGATIYAEFLGGSFSCDAYHTTKPQHDENFGVDPESGIVLCMEQALEDSGAAREDVNYINAHAISARSDLEEYHAVVHCFGQNTKLRMNSTKCMTGHLLGAAGAIEAVATIKAIQTGCLHPNINLEHPNEHVNANLLVGSKKEHLQVKIAMSNSFGFGGHNSSILFAPYEE